MVGNKALQEIKSRSFEKTYRERLSRQKKSEDEQQEQQKELLKKRIQNSHFLALSFYIRRFQREHFFLKARLAQLKNRLLAARKQKRKLTLSQQLSDIQNTLTDLNKEKKKQPEEPFHSHFDSILKPITPFKHIVEERSASLKKQQGFPLYAKQLKLWE